MDVTKILADLRQEREQIEEAILSLERLARGRGRRRGRPPTWMTEITAKRRGRPPGSKNKPSPKAAGMAGSFNRLSQGLRSLSQCHAHVLRVPVPVNRQIHNFPHTLAVQHPLQ